MPWTTPTLDEIRSLNRDNVTSRLRSGAMIPNSVLRVMSDSNSGLAHLTLLYLDWLANQLLPDKAEAEWLERHANIWLGGKKNATYATGIVQFTGNSGITISSGARLRGAIEYQTTSDAVIGDERVSTATIVALTAGANGNLDPGSFLSLDVAVSGVDGNVTVVSLDGGTDAETPDDLRVRVLDRIREPPMGGDKDDYFKWTMKVPGVTRAWVYPQEMGIGTCTVRFMMDQLRSSNAGFPLQGDVDVAASAIDLVRPATVKDMFVEAPIPYPIDVTINSLEPDTPSVRALIAKSLALTLFQRCKPGTTVLKAWINSSIENTPGVDEFETSFVTVVPPGSGYLPILGTLQFLP